MCFNIGVTDMFICFQASTNINTDKYMSKDVLVLKRFSAFDYASVMSFYIQLFNFIFLLLLLSVT